MRYAHKYSCHYPGLRANHVHMVVIVDHRIVGTQFIASANDITDAMNRVPTIQRMHSSNKSLLPCPDDACVGHADGFLGVRDGKTTNHAFSTCFRTKIATFCAKSGFRSMLIFSKIHPFWLLFF